MQIQSMRITATATQVAASDTADQTLKTLATAAEIARVPFAATFHKAAGAAYSSATGDIQITDEDEHVWFSIPAAGFLDSALEKGRAIGANPNAFTANNISVKLHATGTLTAAATSPGLTITIHYLELPLK